MTDLENRRQFVCSVKLCQAVKKHKCLYDQKTSVRKYPPPECVAAWQVVAKECNEPIQQCKNRWKNLHKCFFQGLKRRKNRYYMHDHMTFLLEGEGKGKNKRKQEIEDTNSNATEEIDTIQVDDDEEEEPDNDSHTTSADESNELTKQMTDEKEHENGVGIFIIDEIGEEADEGDVGRRLSYKRSCKRGLDPEVIDELGVDEPEEKRTRKLVNDKTKNFIDDFEKQIDIQQLASKNVIVKMDKLKIANQGKVLPVVKEKKPVMVDSFTYSMTNVMKSTATQYENFAENLDYDEIFLQNIKTQLKEMNARQKMNFKRKIYQSLLEVFDDATDFPNANDVLKMPPKASLRVVNTTTGELRLMRELVSLVQAAKNTPEIIDAKEKVKTAPNTTTNTTTNAATSSSSDPNSKPNNKIPNNEKSSKSESSPLSLSPTLDEDDDDDLQFSLEHIDEDDNPQLPRNWNEIKSKPNPPEIVKKVVEDNVIGLPRHVLQKVVRVAGASGSTIVARDGDKKRIYRIYPKTINPNGTPAMLQKNAAIGTFIVTPTKVNEAGSGATKQMNNVNVRTTTIGNTTQSPSSTNTNKIISAGQTSFRNVHPANRILSSTTGYFKMVAHQKNVSPTTANKTPNNPLTANAAKAPIIHKTPMLPPTIVRRPMAVRSQPALMQRRYSICGPIANNSTPSTASSSSASISQIKISQPISLNSNSPKISNSTTTSTAQVSSTNNSTAKNISPILTTDPEFISSHLNVKLPIQSPKTSAKEKDNGTFTTDTTDKLSAPEEMPIIQAADILGADTSDPLFVKPPQIKSEPTD